MLWWDALIKAIKSNILSAIQTVALVITMGVVIWYTWETSQMRKNMSEQLEMIKKEVEPYLSGWLPKYGNYVSYLSKEGSELISCFTNIGGVAKDVYIVPKGEFLALFTIFADDLHIGVAARFINHLGSFYSNFSAHFKRFLHDRSAQNIRFLAQVNRFLAHFMRFWLTLCVSNHNQVNFPVNACFRECSVTVT